MEINLETASPQTFQIHNEILRLTEQLKITMDTVGWKEIIKPLLDKMIKDVIGYQEESGKWNEGSINQSSMSSENLICYRKALIDFNNKLYQYFEQAKNSKEVLRKLSSDVQPELYVAPFSKSPYRTEE